MGEATDFGDGSAMEASETATILPDDVATRSPQAGLSDGDTEPSETPTILPDDVATRDPQADPGASNAEPNMTGLGPQSQTAGPDAAVTVGPTGPAAVTAASSKAPAEGAGLSAEEKLKKIKRAKTKERRNARRPSEKRLPSRRLRMTRAKAHRSKRCKKSKALRDQFAPLPVHQVTNKHFKVQKLGHQLQVALYLCHKFLPIPSAPASISPSPLWREAHFQVKSVKN